jgi:hypothetical protein
MCGFACLDFLAWHVHPGLFALLDGRYGDFASLAAV